MTAGRILRPLVVSGALALGFFAPFVAHAEPTAQDIAAARLAFTQGKDLEDASDWAGALEKFKKVAEVKVTPQVRFHIALCEENLGKLVSAMKGFELAAEDAKAAGSSAIEVAENAPARAAALKKRVAHLKIVVAGHLSTSKLTLDGAPVASDQIGVDAPMDPGKHVVQLETNGEPAFDKDLTLAEHASETVTVEVHDPDAPPPIAGGPVTTYTSTPSRVPAYVVGGVGVAAIITSSILQGMAQSDANAVEANAHCRPNLTLCNPAYKSEGDTGRSLYTTSLVMGGVGIAAVAAGVVLWVSLGPKKDAKKTGVFIAPTAGGVIANGSF